MPGATGELGACGGGAAQAAEPLAHAFGQTFWVGGRADRAGADPGAGSACRRHRPALELYNLLVMKDGQLFEKDGRYELRFVRELVASGREGLEAITEPAGLSAWFPFDIVGERATGAPLRVRVPRGRGRPDFAGAMVEFTPPSVMELAGRTTRRCGSSSRRRGAGCVLTLINRFDEIGKAARDAAGWHACLDALEASLAGASIDADARLGQVHPDYVARFGPEAATIGPPTE